MSVQHGPGNSAGVVLFERNDSRPVDSGWKVHSSGLSGSFGRFDEVIDTSYQSPTFTLHGAAAYSDRSVDGSKFARDRVDIGKGNIVGARAIFVLTSWRHYDL